VYGTNLQLKTGNFYNHLVMEHSPSRQANQFSPSPEIPHILWNLKVHYRIYCPPNILNISQINQEHSHPSHFLNIHVNIILPFTPRTSKSFLSLTFPQQNIVCTSPLPHTCYIPLQFPPPFQRN